jgi:hypothetical protein
MASLPYTDWPKRPDGTVRNWKVTFSRVNDLDETDTLSFTLAGPDQVMISAVRCNHFGGSPHSGAGWQEVCTAVPGDPGTVQGLKIRIEGKPKGSNTELTCTFVDPAASTGGGACWTAEDG